MSKWLGWLIWMMIPLSTWAQAEEPSFAWHGFGDTYHALRSKDPYDFMSSRSRVRMEMTALKNETNLFVSINAVSNRVLPDQDGLVLREAFLQYHFRNWDLKAGRQIIVWGVADALRLTDWISPMDYTEFLAQDYDDIRVPVNAFRLTRSGTTWKVEMVMVPIPEFFIYSYDPQNPWSVLPPSALIYQCDNDNRPSKTIDHSEYGGRFSIFRNGLDLSVSVLHTWNKAPLLNQWISADHDTLHIRSEFGRIDLVGLDLSIPIGSWVVRGEMTGYRNDLIARKLSDEYRSPLKKNTLAMLIGTDWYPGNEWTLTAQYFHRIIPDHQADMTVDQHQTMATFGITKKLLNTTLTLNSFTYFDLTYDALFSRSSGEYALSDQIHLWLGYDLFHGDDGMFGLYRNNSEIWTKIRYGF